MLTKTERTLLKNLVDSRLRRCFVYAKEHGMTLRLSESPNFTLLDVNRPDGVDDMDFRLLVNCLSAFDGAFGLYQSLLGVRYSDFVRSFCREFHYTLEEVGCPHLSGNDCIA